MKNYFCASKLSGCKGDFQIISHPLTVCYPVLRRASPDWPLPKSCLCQYHLKNPVSQTPNLVATFDSLPSAVSNTADPCLFFPWASLVAKGIRLQFRRCRRLRFDPWVEKIPWRRKWQPMSVFLGLDGQRSLVGYSPWGWKRFRHDLATKQQFLPLKHSDLNTSPRYHCNKLKVIVVSQLDFCLFHPFLNHVPLQSFLHSADRMMGKKSESNQASISFLKNAPMVTRAPLPTRFPLLFSFPSLLQLHWW